jgi:ubiquinone/menaquinone biosynthesis C-methylase UbiE
MLTATRVYKFEYNDTCEMCHDKIDHHKIMGQRLSQSQGLRPKKKTGITVTVKKCSNCGLIYSYPQPVPDKITDHYGISPEDYSWDENYFKYDPKYFARQITVAKELMPFTQGMKALDVGAGLGKAMRAMQEAGFDVYGIEPSPNFRERAIEWLNIPAEKIKLDSAEEVEFPENYFDFITFGAVFEHLYHPAYILERATRWLKPGGIIHIEVPSSRHLLGKIINFYYRLSGTNYVTNLSPMHAPFHLYEYSLKSFTEASQRLKLETVKHYFDVCEILSFPRFTHGVLRKYMELTDTGMQLTVYLRK